MIKDEGAIHYILINVKHLFQRVYTEEYITAVNSTYACL